MSETRNILSRQNNTSKETEVIGSAQNKTKTQTQQVLEATELGAENMVARRVYFVRHGESVEDEKNRDQEKKSPQSPETKLSETGKKQIQKTAKKLKEMGLKKEDILFIYADDTTRVIESLEILLESFGVSGVMNDYRLRTSPKDIDEETGEVKRFTGIKRLLNDVGVSLDTITLMDEILEQNVYKKYKYIVLVGHKSNKAGIKESVENKDRGFQADFEIKNGEIIDIDISIEGSYLSYEEKGLLQITSKNYHEFKEIFPEIEANNVIEFQNKLNEKFAKNEYKYEDYLFQDNEDLRVFCVLKLIKTKNISELNRYFRTQKINISEKCILSKQELLILYYYKEIYPQVLETRKKSLDNRIKDGENIEPYFNFDNQKYNNILPLIQSGKSIKYIEGKPGAGKSYLLSYIAEKLNEENMNNTNLLKPYYPVYINLSGKGIEEIKEVKSEIYKDYKVVYLLDSIDESSITGEERKNLDQKLLDFSQKAKIIITSRNGYLFNYNDNINEEKEQKYSIKRYQEIVKMNDLLPEYIESYVKKYFGEENEKNKGVNEILKKLNGVGNNPLILCMICEIVESGEGFSGETTIIKLYEKLINLRLLDWNIDKNGRDVIKKGDVEGKRLKALNKKISKLSTIAYLQIIGGKSFILEDLEKIIDAENLDIESFNLLFRKSKSGEYDFVHQSFKEYFAAKYIFEEMESNPEFDITILKKLDFLGIDFLSTLIKDNEKITELLLSKININNLQYGTEKKLYLIGKINKKVMFSYLPKIESYYKYGNSKELFFILGLLGGDDCLNFIKNLLNHSSSIRTKAFLELDSKGNLDTDDLILLLDNEYEDIRLLSLDKLYTKVELKKFKSCIHNFSLNYKVVIAFENKGYLDTNDLILLLENKHEDIRLWALDKLYTKVELEQLKLFIDNSSIKVKARVIYYCSKLLGVNYYDVIKLFPYNFKIYEKIIETSHYDGIEYYLQLETGELSLIYIKTTRDKYADENEK